MKRLPIFLLTALVGLAAAPAVSFAQLAPGSGREESTEGTQTVVTPFIGNTDRTFVTQVFFPPGSNDPRVRFYEADSAGTEDSRRLIQEASLPVGDREVDTAERELRETQRECFVAYLDGDSVELRSLDEELRDVGDDDEAKFDATSGRICVTVKPDANPSDPATDPAAVVPADRYLVGRRGTGPRSETFGRPLYRPRTLRARSNVLLVRIRWRNWTRAVAVGRGTVRVTVGGRRHLRFRNARIVVSGLKRGQCRDGAAMFYTRATVTYPRGSRLARTQRLRLSNVCSTAGRASSAR